MSAAMPTRAQRKAGIERPTVGVLSSKSFLLWFGVLGPPLLWGANVVLGDLISELGCAPGMREKAILSVSLTVWEVIQTAVLFALIVLAGLGSYRAWGTLRRSEGSGEPHGTAFDRAHALALAGMLSALVYGLLLVYAFVATFFLHPCRPSL